MIDSTQLEKVFTDSMYREEEVADGATPNGAVLVEGVLNRFGFHPKPSRSP